MKKIINRYKQVIVVYLLTLFSFGTLFYSNVFAEDIVVEGNNTGSENSVTIEANQTQNVNQSNSAEVQNNVTADLDTGNNTIEDATNGNSTISTGDAQLTTTIATQANFSSAQKDCCATGSTNANISGNNSASSNSVSFNNSSQTNININQNAKVTNSVNANINTGKNSIKDTTGTSLIKTGDIKGKAEVVNGPINMTEVSFGESDPVTFLTINNNNSETVNNIKIEDRKSSSTEIDNFADINNFLNVLANTGENKIEDNNGDTSIVTGDVYFSLFVKNGPINTNLTYISCCNTNPDTPEPPEEPETPVEPGRGGGGGSSSSGSSSSGSTGGPQVLGLSDTQSAPAQSLFFFLGIILLGLGAKSIASDIAFKNTSATK